jgi:hypothetical protein
MNLQLKERAELLDKYAVSYQKLWLFMTDDEKKELNEQGCGRSACGDRTARLRLWLNGNVNLENAKQLWKLFSLISANDDSDRGDSRNYYAIDSIFPYLKQNMPREELAAFVSQYNIGRKPFDVDNPSGIDWSSL